MKYQPLYLSQINWRHLTFLHTGIKKLPKEFNNLKRLRYTNLSSTSKSVRKLKRKF